MKSVIESIIIEVSSYQKLKEEDKEPDV